MCTLDQRTWVNHHLPDLFRKLIKRGCVDYYFTVKKQPSQDVLHGDAAEEELGLACLVSSYTLPHQSSQPGGRGRQTACSKC